MADENKQHQINLAKLCRVCGLILPERTFLVKENINLIKESYYLDVSGDNDCIHPPKICLKCHTTARNIAHRSTTTQIISKQWVPHKNECPVCNRVKSLSKGGRPPKKKSLGDQNSLLLQLHGQEV